MILLSNYDINNMIDININKDVILNRLKIKKFLEKLDQKEMDLEINKKIKNEEAKIIIYRNRVYFN
jgi:hypothetical protein